MGGEEEVRGFRFVRLIRCRGEVEAMGGDEEVGGFRFVWFAGRQRKDDSRLETPRQHIIKPCLLN